MQEPENLLVDIKISCSAGEMRRRTLVIWARACICHGMAVHVQSYPIFKTRTMSYRLKDASNSDCVDSEMHGLPLFETAGT